MRNRYMMFDPRTIALIGASDKEGSVGRFIMENLLRSKERKVFPVNPHRSRILDSDCYPSIADVPAHVDLAVVATQAGTVPGLVEECGRAGVDGVVIASAGFKEADEKGSQLEKEIDLIRKKYGIRIMGPNCIGFVRPSLGLNVSFLKTNPPSGNIAFISQSGALGSAILDWGIRAGIGFSMFASLGSMLDIDFGDMIDFLGDDEDTRSILIYMEDVGNARKFMSAARAFSSHKPIIILKPGRFPESAKAAHAHTGATAGYDPAYEAAFRRAGIVRVGEIAELFDAAKVLDSKKLPAGPSVAIVTSAGGPGVMATDTLMSLGGQLASLSEESMDQLNAFLPPYWSRSNPIDLLAEATVDKFKSALDICLRDPMVNGVLVIYAPVPSSPSTLLAQAMADIAKNAYKPVVVTWMGGEEVEEGRRVFVEKGVPHFDTPEEAVRAYMNMYRYKKNLDQLYETPAELQTYRVPLENHLKGILKAAVKEGRKMLNWDESRDFLAAYGIPVAEAWHRRKEDAAPVSPGKMYGHVDCELILSSRKDKDFGSVIVFGRGGEMTEFINDLSHGLPPLNQTLAKILMQDTRVYKVLREYRSRQTTDFKGLDEILVNFSNLIVDFPEIAEIKINPLAMSDGKATALDARIIIDGDYSTVGRSPYPHLIITPYPYKYNTNFRLLDGTEVLIRAIRPEDEPAEHEMMSSLSPETIKKRFMSISRDISHEWLVLMCNIDYGRNMAIVAETQGNGKKQMIGIARLIMNQNLTSAEVAVLVQDRYQRKHLGTKFVEMLIEIARERGLEEVHADVLTENKIMLDVFRRLGFSTKWNPGGLSNAVLRL